MLVVFFVLRHLAILLLLAAAAWTAGRLLLRPLQRQAAATPWGLTLAAGLAAMGHACYLAALAGGLTRVTAGAIAALLLVICMVRVARGSGGNTGSGGIGAVSVGFGLPSSLRALIGAIWWLAFVVIVVTGFTLALYPPLGFDETMYHLPYARAMASTGGIAFWPSLRFPTFPQLAEALNAAVLLLARDDVATQLPAWLAMCALVGLTAAWTRELCIGEPPRMRNVFVARPLDGAPGAARASRVGRVSGVSASPAVSEEPVSEREATPYPGGLCATMPLARAAGLLAVACLVSSPMTFLMASAGYVEPLLALCGMGALYAAWRAAGARERDRAAGEPARPGASRSETIAWTLVSALLAGSAASIKYLGLFFVPAALIMLLPPLRRRAPSGVAPATSSASSFASVWLSRDLLRDVALFLVVAVALLAPTYIHIARLTGNPVFPFYPHWFGPNDWAWPEEVLRPERGLDRVWRVLTMFWDLSFRRHLLGGLPPLSPVFIVGAPLAIVTAWRHAALRRPLVLAIAWIVFATTHGHHVFGMLPMWSLLIGASAAAIASDVARAKGRAGAADSRDASTSVTAPARTTAGGPVWLMAGAALLALGGAAYGAARLQRLGPPPATPRARVQLLAAQRPLYPAIVLLARTAGAAPIYVVGAPEMAYFANGPLLGDFVGPASWDRIEARARALDSVADALKELRVGFLLVPNQPTAGIEGMRPLIERWKALVATDSDLVAVYTDAHATIYRVESGAPALARAHDSAFSKSAHQ